MGHQARLAGSSWIRRAGGTVQVHEQLRTCHSKTTTGPGTVLVMVRKKHTSMLLDFRLQTSKRRETVSCHVTCASRRRRVAATVSEKREAALICIRPHYRVAAQDQEKVGSGEAPRRAAPSSRDAQSMHSYDI